MANFNRRDFLLNIAPVAAASTILLSGRDSFSFPPIIQLQSPANNQSFTVGEQVSIVATLIPNYRRKLRIDFRVNGMLIGSGTARTPRLVWIPTQPGNYTITAEAILPQGNIVDTASSNITVQQALTVLYDHLGGPNAPGGARPWEWEGQVAYDSWSSPGQTQCNVLTAYIGTLASPTVLRRVEAAFLNGSPTLTQFFTLENVAFNVKVWNANLPGGFTVNACVANLLQESVGSVGSAVGSRTTPVGSVVLKGTSYPVYHLGWDVNLSLPSGVPLELSIQAVADGVNNSVFSFLSSATSPQMYVASRIGSGTQTGNYIPNALAARLWAQP